MQLKAQELALIHHSVNQVSVSEQEKALLRELCVVITSYTEGEGQEKHFIDSEVNLSTLQKAFVIKALKSLSWNNATWDVVDVVVEKLN